MTDLHHGLRTSLLGGVALALCAGAALAQEATNEVEEVVVTAPNYVPTTNTSATKVAIALIETPQSISVVTRDQMDLLHLDNLQQAVRYTAGAIGENFGADERYDWITLRGFQPVQYVDGLQAPIGSVVNVGTELYGAESVEILKGPSGVLYGQSPPGGLVNMTMRRPRTEFGGEIQAQIGTFEHKQLAGDVTGAIVGDTVSARLTGLIRERGTQTDFTESKRSYIAPAFTFQLSPDTSLTLLTYYQEDTVDKDGGGFLPDRGTMLPNPNGQIPVNRNGGEPSYNHFERQQGAIGYEFSHRFGDRFRFVQNLKYSDIYTYQRSVYGAGLQADLRTMNRANFAFDEDIKQIAIDTRMEIRATTGAIEHTGLVGFDYRDYHNVSRFAFAAGPTIDIYNPVYGVAVTPFAALGPFTNQLQNQYGLYVQDAMKIGDFRLTLSARKDYLDTKNRATGITVQDDAFTYRAGLNYVHPSGFAPYVVYSTSFQPTPGALHPSRGGTPFVPRKGKQLEAGIKVEPRWLPRDYKMFATAAVYDLQQDNVLVSDPLNPFFNIQTSDVSVKGLELEAVGRIRERLSFNLSYSFTETDSPTNLPAPQPQRGELPIVPKHKASGFVDYTFQTGPLAGFGGGVGVRYLGETFGNAANTPAYRAEAQTLVDAMIHWDWNDWKASINASNLFDEVYVQQCSRADSCFYSTRRMVYLTVGRKF